MTSHPDKRGNPLTILPGLIVLGGLLYYFLSSVPVTVKAQEEMKQAHADYIQGETAKTLGERRVSFNDALKRLTTLEDAYHPIYSTGKLYYNIANSYFQLGEYPMAILYYHRARQLMPRAEKPKRNLKAAQEKLGIKPLEKKTLIESLLPDDFRLSLPERLQLFFAFAVLALFFTSLFLWQKKGWMKKIAALFGFLAAAVLLLLGYHHYFCPIRAVIVRSTALRRDAGIQYAKVLDQPVLSGNTVEVLDVFKEGRWLKVMTPDGHLGYVPSDSIRVIYYN